jgi:hypothetical protein
LVSISVDGRRKKGLTCHRKDVSYNRGKYIWEAEAVKS